MKNVVVVGWILVATICISANADAQGPSSPEAAAEQIAFVALINRSRAVCDADSSCTERDAVDVVMDSNGAHVIPINFVPETRGAWSPDGTMMLESGTDIFLRQLVGGPAVNLTNHPGTYLTPAWSPDGTRIAFSSDRDGGTDLYVMNVDGSNVVRIVTGVATAWHPTWSPDSARLAFSCIVDPVTAPFVGNHDICAINADGSGFVRLTSGPEYDDEPEWSPDGTRIVFDTTRYGGTVLAVMGPDGTNVTPLTLGLEADAIGPNWSSDGTRIVFTEVFPFDPDLPPDAIYSFVTFVDNGQCCSGGGIPGFGLTTFAGGRPTWRPWTGVPNDRPAAAFTFECMGHTCSFDASGSSDSDGTVTAYGWQFADGTAVGEFVTHTFTNSHGVRLIVMDDRGALATTAQNVNQPPVASFTATCVGLTCTFDGSASYDPDGTIAGVSWDFGSPPGGGPLMTTHVYAVPGTYTVTLTIVDEEGGRTTASQSVVVFTSKQNQIIAFNALPDKTTSDPPFAVSATASSGLAVSFAASGNCTVSGNTVTITGAGSCTITASQPGDSNFNPAPSVRRAFNITSGGGGPSAVFVGVDSTTRGSWQGVYGGDGYNVINDFVGYPAYAQVTPSGQASYTWAASTADARGLQKATNPADRIAATWYGYAFSIDLNLTDGNVHQVGFYVLDWDAGGRSETLEVRDAVTNTLLDARTVTNFQNGQYVLWNLRGHVRVNVILASGVNAVLSGVFFGGNASPPPPPNNTAAFVGVDSTTQGSWQGVYGLGGYNVINDAVNYPPFAQIVPIGQGTWTWAASTSDVRGLQKATNPADRIAATWYGYAFSLDVNLTDGNAHQVGVYLVDWDARGRGETIEIREAVTNALLDTRTVTGFQNGRYLVWNISGHVTVNVVVTAGVNAVMSGVFVGP